MTLRNEISANLARNRRPMLFWSAVAMSPLIIAAVCFGAWMNFGRAAATPDSILSVQVPIADRTWSIYQSIDCIQNACADEDDARSFLISSAPGKVRVTTATGIGAFQFASMGDAEWKRLAALATQDGAIKLADVTESSTGVGATATFTSNGYRGRMSFSSKDEPALKSIVIGSRG